MRHVETSPDSGAACCRESHDNGRDHGFHGAARVTCKGSSSIDDAWQAVPNPRDSTRHRPEIVPRWLHMSPTLFSCAVGRMISYVWTHVNLNLCCISSPITCISLACLSTPYRLELPYALPSNPLIMRWADMAAPHLVRYLTAIPYSQSTDSTIRAA